MARYIDSEIFVQNCAKNINQFSNTLVPLTEVAIKIGRAIRETPAADVVEVVRCKDCKHRGEYGCPMYHETEVEWDDDGYTECETIIHDNTTDDSFCSYGERR